MADLRSDGNSSEKMRSYRKVGQMYQKPVIEIIETKDDVITNSGMTDLVRPPVGSRSLSDELFG